MNEILRTGLKIMFNMVVVSTLTSIPLIVRKKGDKMIGMGVPI